MLPVPPIVTEHMIQTFWWKEKTHPNVTGGWRPAQCRPGARYVAMEEAAGDDLCGGQEQDGQPHKGQLLDMEVSGLDNQNKKETLCWLKHPLLIWIKCKGMPPPNIIKRLDFKHLLKRLGFSLEMAQTVVCNHGYDTAKKLSCLKLMILTSLSKPYAPQAESVMTEKKTGISVPHHMHWHLHIILFHWVCSDFCPMIYTITNLVGNYDVMMTP